MRKTSLRTLMFLMLGLPAQQAGAATQVFSTHTFVNRTNARNTALAGAVVALPMNSNASFDNPAAQVFQTGLLSVSYGGGKHTGLKPALTDGKQEPSTYTSISGAIKPVNLVALGAGYNKSKVYFQKEAQRETADFSAVHTEIPIALGVRLTERAAVGLGYVLLTDVYNRGLLNRSFSTLQESEYQFEGSAMQVSTLIGLTETVSVGATFTTAAELSSTTKYTEGSETLKTSQPASARLGVAYFLPFSMFQTDFPWEHTVFFQTDIVSWDFFKSAQKRYHPSVLMNELQPRSFVVTDANSNNGTLAYDRGVKVVPRLALETVFLRTETLMATNWLGAYLEPKTFNIDEARPHFTVGAEVTVWMISAFASVDLAKEFNNPVFGLGLAFR